MQPMRRLLFETMYKAIVKPKPELFYIDTFRIDLYPSILHSVAYRIMARLENEKPLL